MNHKTYRKLLHLYRPGELDEGREKKLERHLQHCPQCAEEKRAIENAARLIGEARDKTPRHSNPRLLAEGILAAVRHEQAAEENRLSWLDRFFPPKMRFAAAGIALVMAALFLLQSALILHRVSRLEQKMARQAEVQLPSDTILTRQLERTGISRTLDTAGRRSTDWPDDWVVIRKRTLISLLKSLKDQQVNERLFELLGEELELTRDIYRSGGIKNRELKNLLKKKNRLLKIIYDL
jgi:hypothetical protein